MELHRIEITLEIDEEGRHVTGCCFDDPDGDGGVPLVTGLGMLELAKDTLIRVRDNPDLLQ